MSFPPVPVPVDLAAATPEPSEKPPVHVLVVDDIEHNLLVMEALLDRPGLSVLTARSGPEALELMLQHDIALAMLDVQMPDMDGFALAELMRGASRTRNVPIIFVTAAPIDADRTFQGYEAGAGDLLYKPVDSRILISKVNVFVELYEQRRQLREQNEALQRLIKFNETMTAVLGHDLRTPLAAIVMGAQALYRGAHGDEVRQAARRIKDSGSRMARMVDQLLDFSRLRAGTLALNRQPVDLGELAGRVVAELQQAHPQALLSLDCDGDMQAELDPDRMMQVLSNLLSNALQHGEAGSAIEVVVDGTAPGDGPLRLQVGNRGSLPPDMLDRLFLPFSSGKRESTGLGLGLFIVERFVHAHGGSVRGHSSGQQTWFDIVLPRGR